MKKALLFISLLLVSLSFSQIDYGKQVKKKDVDKGLISFVKTTDDKGNVSIGFRMDDLPVGPQLNIDAAGIKTYSNYNKDHVMDGTTIIMNSSTGEVTLYTYRNNLLDGPAFQIANGKIAWTKQFKKGFEDPNGYTVNHSFDFYTDKNKPNFEGFTIEKYKTSYALGYFAYGSKAFPIIQIWDAGDSFYGQCIQGLRKEFGVYFFANKNIYIGAWHKNNQEGLGFIVDKNLTVIQKGFYDAGTLKISL
ncbi:hypothetical protein GOQ30_09035 [Flavobacterium sp. TP390]|uniref:Uncharacterized protein n=1 Tax=Flavobacterium profundi TaxID=1774945 RepID=A0A6I4II01_9FLAO|nr:hypothetical protein [Flavobacterium profundi]MVO09300.1 hypothetical protein [Flavobacterium profundi]